MAKLRISYNAPVVLTFAIAATVLHLVLGPSPWLSAWPDLSGPASYVGLVSHVLGHANWEHLFSNISMILLIGPILEERDGSRAMLLRILVTALITAGANLLLSDDGLIGASGIVFMLILLASTANIRAGEIPLTLIAVAVLFLGRELVEGLRPDGVSQLAHIVGGLAGAAYGFLGAGSRRPRRHPAGFGP